MERGNVLLEWRRGKEKRRRVCVVLGSGEGEDGNDKERQSEKNHTYHPRNEEREAKERMTSEI